FPWALPGLLAATLVSSVLIWKRLQTWQPDFRQIARQIEKHHPALHALLLTAVEQQPEGSTGQFNYLQQRVIDEALNENQRHHWIETISRRRLLAMEWVQFSALVAFVVVLLSLHTRATAPAESHLAPSQTVTVTPGDTSVERGS